MDQRLRIQRQHASEHNNVPSKVSSSLVEHGTSGTARPLESATRAALEPKFRHSFENVRVFADDRAAESADALAAQAYAVGSNIVFNAGRYEPNSSEGQRLLAHELAHTIQQGGTAGHVSLPSELNVSQSGETNESEAKQAADSTLSGQAMGVGLASGAMIARLEDENQQASFPDPNQTVIPTITETAPQSNPKAPTSFPGDVPSEPDPMSDVPEYDPLTWLAKKGLGGVLGKLLGVPGGIIMGTLGMESDESPAQREARKRQESEQAN